MTGAEILTIIMIAVNVLLAVVLISCVYDSIRSVDGFCFVRHDGDKDQLIFNLSKDPEEALNQRVVVFRVVKNAEVLNYGIYDLTADERAEQ
jgi:hypothetical protein